MESTSEVSQLSLSDDKGQLDHSGSCTNSPASSTSGVMLDDLSDGFPGSLIGAENYLSITEGCKLALTVSQLTQAVDKCKLLVLDSTECSEERKWLVRRLIELRYKLILAKEAEEEKKIGIQTNSETKVILGHHLTLHYEPTSTSKQYCDRCCGAIWNVLQSWYECTDCHYKCHVKCMIQTCRVCSHLRISEAGVYEARICPEVGLSVQGYRCEECKGHISYKNSWIEPRQCDYNGLYYCASCHWNNTAIVPARVVHNWDFVPHAVCRASYQLLRLTRNRPLLTLNEKLYGFVKELAQIKKLRRDLLLMKAYLVRCREALEQKIIWKQLSDRAHFLQESEAFSLRDLIDLNSGVLLPQIETAANYFIKHIKEDCRVCSSQGHICELCGDKESIIFPFDSAVVICPKCNLVSHKYCSTSKPECGRCKRIEKRSHELANDSNVIE